MAITEYYLGSGWSRGTVVREVKDIPRQQLCFVWVDDDQRQLNSCVFFLKKAFAKANIKNVSIALICPRPATRFQDAYDLLGALSIRCHHILGVWVDVVDGRCYELRDDAPLSANEIYPGKDVLRWLKDQGKFGRIAAVSSFGVASDIQKAITEDLELPLHYRLNWKSDFDKYLEEEFALGNK